MDDIILLEKVIGTGEIAISDHRSSQPTQEDFSKIVADTRVGGILAGKAGIVNVHMGDGKEMLSYLRHVLENTQIPAANMLPTHINRNDCLLQDGLDYAKNCGGYIDLTTSMDPSQPGDDGVKASTALKMALDAGVPVAHITFSSDGQGSLPVFNAAGEFIGLGVGKVKSLYEEMKAAVLEEGITLEDALKPVTSNTADCLKLTSKGRVLENADADLVLLDQGTLEIDTVFAKGQKMFADKKLLVKGTFE